jgi:hypothetical protein
MTQRFRSDYNQPYEESDDDDDESDENEEIPFETLYKIKLGIEYEIDNFMREIGISHPERFTDENGWRVLKRGSALIFVGATVDERVVTLRAFAKIMDFPSDKDLILPLMRELLEINADLPNECRFAIRNNVVIATISKLITEYSETMVPFCIDLISGIADDYDDYFIGKYGGTSKKRN